MIAKICMVAGGLVKDRGAWISGSVSTITAKLAGGFAALTFPTSAEGWGALAASLVTVVYIGSKTYLLWRNASLSRQTRTED